MANRKIPEDEKRTHCVMVRFNDFEYGEICDRAAKMNIPLAAYVRQQAFNHNLKVTYEVVCDSEAIYGLVTEFGKIGSNLNQIARYFNTGGLRSMEMEDDIHDCISMLFDLRKEVLKLGGGHRGSTKTHRRQEL